MRRSLFPLLLALASLTTGCVEVDEQWLLNGVGGGTYDLTIAWDADLWRRAKDACGPKTAQTLGKQVRIPLRAAAMRDSLAGLPGITVSEVVVRTRGDGYRVLSVKLAFRKLADLLAWEVMAGRPIKLRAQPEAKPTTAVLAMKPFLALPVVDPVLATHALVRATPKRASDPHGSLAAWGIEPDRAQLVWNMIRGPLKKAALRMRVQTPGALLSVDGAPRTEATTEAVFTWDFKRIRRGAPQRHMSLAWRVSEFDSVLPISARPARAWK